MERLFMCYECGDEFVPWWDEYPGGLFANCKKCNDTFVEAFEADAKWQAEAFKEV